MESIPRFPFNESIGYRKEFTDVPVLVLLGGFAERDFKGEQKIIVDHWKLKMSLKKKKKSK